MAVLRKTRHTLSLMGVRFADGDDENDESAGEETTEETSDDAPDETPEENPESAPAIDEAAYQAKIAQLELANADLVIQLAQAKADNYDLLMTQASGTVDTDADSESDEDDSSTEDDEDLDGAFK